MIEEGLGKSIGSGMRSYLSSENLNNTRSRLLSEADLADLSIITLQNFQGYLNFTLTAVALENDGDIAFTESEVFTVTFNHNPDNTGEDGSTPQTPLLNVPNLTIVNDTVTGDNVGLEDGQLILVLTATEGAGETLDVVVTVTISDVPPGFTVEGAIFNPQTQEYSANADAFTNGLVRITPPEDFSGFFDITVESVATAGTGQSSTSGQQTLTAYVDPVADGVSISAGPTSGFEDTNLTFSVTFTDLDDRNDETFYDGVYFDGGNSAWFYVRFNDPLTAFIFGYTIVLAGDADAAAFGFDLTGYYRIPISDAGGFDISFLENWHGTVIGDIRVPYIEISDDFDGDNFILSSR